jgi:hypothetical protein
MIGICGAAYQGAIIVGSLAVGYVGDSALEGGTVRDVIRGREGG